jgi:hypothetical protein
MLLFSPQENALNARKCIKKEQAIFSGSIQAEKALVRWHGNGRIAGTRRSCLLPAPPLTQKLQA